MDEGSPDLGVDFVIDFGNSFGGLKTLDDLIGATQAKAVREFQRIQSAISSGMDLSEAAGQFRNLGATATRELRSVAQEAARVERSGEALVRQLEKQNATFGKSRTEIQAMRVEEAALAAERVRNTDLAVRLRAELALLTGAQTAASAAAEAEAQARRDAAHGYDLFEAAARRGIKAMREEQAAQSALDTERHAQGLRSAAHAYDLFEARARQGAAALREQEAAQRAVDNERKAAIGSADAYAAKLESETAAIGRTAAELREMEVAQRAAAAEAAGMPEQATRIREAGAAYAQAQAGAAALVAEERRLADASREAEQAARQAAAAQAAQDASVDSLRSSVDPLHNAQQRLSRELENAVRLYRMGAIGQDEYERSSTVLAGRLDEVQRAQARQTNGVEEATRGSKLGASDLTNIAFQLQDIVISLQGGQKPLTVLMQQGSQLGGIMMQTGASAGDMMRAILGIAIVSTPTAAAVTALAEAEVEQAAAQTAATTAGSRAAITAAELAVTTEAATVAAAQHAAAQEALALAEAQATAAGANDAGMQAALAAAQQAASVSTGTLASAQNAVALAEAEAAGTAEVAAAAARQLAAAQTAAADASTAAAASATRSLAPWLAGLIAFAAPLAVAYVAFDRWEKRVSDDAHLKQYSASLGLTHQEMKKLGDQSVTTGDLLAGFTKTVSERLGLNGSGKKLIDYFFGKDDAAQVGNFVAEIYGLFVGGYKGIVATWRLLPAALGDLFTQAVNTAASAIEAMINKSIVAVNALARGANGLLHMDLFGQIDTVQVTRMVNTYAGAGKMAGAAFGDNVSAETKKAKAAMAGFFADVGANSQAAARARLKKQADTIIADRTPDKPKVDRNAEKLARDAEAVEAQIKNLYKLADAYGVSGAEALIAEARVKAESQAIKQNNDQIDAAIARQVRLAIAQRVSDAAKSTAGLNDQAAAQERVNALVAAGLVPAVAAAQLAQDQLAMLPLLAAQQAALRVNDQKGYAEATKAIGEVTAAQARLNRAKAETQFNASMAAGADQLAQLRLEGQLIGANVATRAHALATLKATQEANRMIAEGLNPAKAAEYVAKQVEIADAQQALSDGQRDYNDQLTLTADRWDIIASKVQSAGQGMADAFGEAGRAIGDVASIFTAFQADRARAEQQHLEKLRQAGSAEAKQRENALFALRTSGAQVEMYGDLAGAAKGFFKEGSAGYKAMAAAEKVYRVAQLAMSLQAMIQHALETTSHVAGAAAQATADGTAGIAAQSKLPFPFNIAAMAATGAALVAAGIAVFGGGGGAKAAPVTNTGTGTVLGDPTAKSESIKRSIDQLGQIETLMLTASRSMEASLRSIDSQIGGFAAQILKAGDINANAGVTEGFKTNAIGSVLKAVVPVFGGLLSKLFGSTTTVTGSGLFGNAQSLGSILSGGFDASYYSDVQKKSKFLGITTSTKNSTQYTNADAALENQFTLILRSFNDAIAAAAGPLGESTDAIQQRLNGFVVNIGKIDLTGLTGDQITEKLQAVFGAAADQMATGAFPGIERFQKAGEGAFETLVRVASTVESVTSALDELGGSARSLGIDAKLGLAGQFDSIGAMSSAVDAYFQGFFSKEEQAAAKTAQFARVFDGLGLSMPATLAAFRQLVEAQDLTTSAGQATYATLLQLAPAFADLKSAMDGAKSAADIMSERQDLERQLLQLKGDTAAIRALDLAKVDASNRALQEQVWAVQDAQDAAKAADALREAWTSVGDSIMDEVKRIRGLTDTGIGTGFAAIMGQFNAATSAARGGDQDAAKSLPGLSQALLKAAEDQATSRQELARVQAQTAASLEATYGVIGALANAGKATTADTLTSAATVAQATAAPVAANDDTATAIRELRDENAAMRADLTAALATIAGNTGRIDRKLDAVTADSQGQAISVASAA